MTLFPEPPGKDGLTPAQWKIAKAMREKDLEENVRDACKQLRLLRYHVLRPKGSPAGFPDDVIVGRKGMLYRELKSQTGKTSPEQEKWLAGLAAVGADAGLWRPSDWLTGRIQRELGALM